MPKWRTIDVRSAVPNAGRAVLARRYHSLSIRAGKLAARTQILRYPLNQQIAQRDSWVVGSAASRFIMLQRRRYRQTEIAVAERAQHSFCHDPIIWLLSQQSGEVSEGATRVIRREQ